MEIDTEDSMKLFKKMKDGGKDSTVVGYWLIEAKSLLSIVLLNFQGKSREAFHTHAFNCWNILLKGELTETLIDGRIRTYKPSLKPFYISKDDFHKVDSKDNSWLISFRGKWSPTWKEYLPETKEVLILMNNRVIINKQKL